MVSRRSTPGPEEFTFRIRATRVGSRRPHIRYEPTPHHIVRSMLTMAGVTGDDVVFDLGSGDGRIVIAAARDFGAQGVGIETDPERVAQAQGNAAAAQVASRVQFLRQDLFEADLSRATVVTLYLLPEVNLMLRPRLLRDLQPGARVVSYTHDMKDWPPLMIRRTMDRLGWYHQIYLWAVPERGRASPQG